MEQSEKTADILAQARAEIDAADREMADAFSRRMAAVTRIAAKKAAAGLPIYNGAREEAVLAAALARVAEAYRPAYRQVMTSVLAASRAYQAGRMTGDDPVLAAEGVRVLPGGLARAGELFSLHRRVLILTDDGVPPKAVSRVAACCQAPLCLTLPAGEASKRMENFCAILTRMQAGGFDRTDAVLAVGGGVICDLGAFAAACYLRGVDFYAVPTTLLAMVDASVGGKCGVDFGGVKNTVGVIRRPTGVLIDPDVLQTLPVRQMTCGMAEIIKIAALCDAGLFNRLVRGEEIPLPDLIVRAVRLKCEVVARDREEHGLRRILNFGHTLGHGYEAASGGKLLHGECVALGMLSMAAPAVREGLLAFFARVGLPSVYPYDRAAALALTLCDKKRAGDEMRYVYVTAPGVWEIRSLPVAEFERRGKEGLPF